MFVTVEHRWTAQSAVFPECGPHPVAGNGEFQPEDRTSRLRTTRTPWRWPDLNGDGRPDIVTTEPEQPTPSACGSNTTNPWQIPPPCLSALKRRLDFGHRSAAERRWRWADLNGDGRPDIVVNETRTANSVRRGRLNTITPGGYHSRPSVPAPGPRGRAWVLRVWRWPTSNGDGRLGHRHGEWTPSTVSVAA